MATIKPIEGRSVHQIQSGQVIVDLCSVVKELVENSLDAGATFVEVRFKDSGLEAVEVQDNGAGISPEDYETIAMKHYTSKLSSYDDLSSLTTFGFRGEALSSLCALSKFHITTARVAEAPKGRRLDFEVSGKLKGTGIAASQKGTTVAVEDLFYNLPVRRRELQKNIKREYRKVLEILHAYACISEGVKLSVTHQPPKGKKASVFSTQGSQSTKDNIANIYGAKTLSALVPLDLKLELHPTSSQGLQGTTEKVEGCSKAINLVGYVSKPIFGEGRSTPDRQMFFVNNRPCLLPQISKAFNEVYKSYNVTQSPFIFANLKMDTNAYDVNVSPDKRSILLHDQTALLEAMKRSLVELFEAQEQTVPQSQLPSTRLPSFKPLTVSEQMSREASSKWGAGSDTSKPGLKHFPSSPVADSSRSTPSQPASTYPANDAPEGLMSRFVARNAQDRGRTADDAAKAKQQDEPSKEKQRLAKSVANATRHQSPAESPVEERISPPMEAAQLSRHVQDLNAPTRSQWDETNDQAPTMSDNNKQPEDDQNSVVEVQQPTASPVSVLDRLPAKRTTQAEPPKQSSEVVDAPTAKKRKLSISKGEMTRFSTSQSSQFSQRISAFAAPGSHWSRPTPDVDRDPGEEAVDDEESDSESESENYRTDTIAPHESTSQPALDLDPDDDHRPRHTANGEEEHDGDEGADGVYVDEEERRRRDEARVQAMVQQAEAASARSEAEQEKRTARLSKSSIRRDTTLGLMQVLETSAARIDQQLSRLTQAMEDYRVESGSNEDEDAPPSSKASPEERLSLTIAKSDFGQMRINGQFNLGFILATRPAQPEADASKHADELFIIDQHASDEIFNFHRLSSSTTLTAQPLVRPHPLEVTAVEEEIIMSHRTTLLKNGFNITVDESGELPVGQRCHLLTLPTSRETVFDTRDLEELIALLSEATPAAGEIIRPSKVRKMLAMRACRSSIMIGKTLNRRKMQAVVRHMGEIDKPWNCPHGRPTMRHLASLGQWGGWEEGEGLVDDEPGEGTAMDWTSYLEAGRVGGTSQNRGMVDEDGVLDEDHRGHGYDEYDGISDGQSEAARESDQDEDSDEAQDAADDNDVTI